MNLTRFPIKIPHLIMLKSRPTLIGHQKTAYSIVMS